MNQGDKLLLGAVTLALLAGVAVADLHRVETGSITIYTTPALRDLLEKGIIPPWEARSGLNVEPVYVAAGEQYNRLRMSGSKPEADLFLHASPLFLVKGYEQGEFLPLDPRLGDSVEPQFRGRRSDSGQDPWVAFAWSPLVEVYDPRLGAPPDLVRGDASVGLPHPTLSNNGVYVALFLEEVAPQARDHVRRHTVVQPVNARTNILGVADGSFEVTLGYEAVARFFQAQGAPIAYAAPLIDGRQVSTPVLFSVALVDGPRPDAAREFASYLFEKEVQEIVGRYHFRSVHNLTEAPPGLPDDLEMVELEWDWRDIEETLPLYEVRAGG